MHVSACMIEEDEWLNGAKMLSVAFRPVDWRMSEAKCNEMAGNGIVYRGLFTISTVGQKVWQWQQVFPIPVSQCHGDSWLRKEVINFRTKRLSTNPTKLRGSGGRPEGEKNDMREAERGRSWINQEFFVMEPGFNFLGHCWVLRVRDWRADMWNSFG